MSKPDSNVSPTLLGELFQSPRLYPAVVNLRRGKVQFRVLTEANYHESSFLDNRLVSDDSAEMVMDLDDLLALRERVAPCGRAAHFIFHIGHCGSTLLSRLVGETAGFFSVREPPALMLLATCHRYLGYPGLDMSRDRWWQIFELVQTLLTRTYCDTDTALIKPTSHSNNIMRELLDRSAESRAVLLYVGLDAYLATVLREHRRPETQAFLEQRLHDFKRMVHADGLDAEGLTSAQKAALIWLVHMAEFQDILQDEAYLQRVRLVDFDRYLRRPSQSLASIIEFLGKDPDRELIRRITGGGVARAYAKSVEPRDGSYDRDGMLAASRDRYGEEIEQGLRWADEIGQRYRRLQGLAMRYRTSDD